MAMAASPPMMGPAIHARFCPPPDWSLPPLPPTAVPVAAPVLVVDDPKTITLVPSVLVDSSPADDELVAVEVEVEVTVVVLVVVLADDEEVEALVPGVLKYVNRGVVAEPWKHRMIPR